jgi:hypothetical protein
MPWIFFSTTLRLEKPTAEGKPVGSIHAAPSAAIAQTNSVGRCQTPICGSKKNMIHFGHNFLQISYT